MAKTNATQENQTVYEKLSKSEQMVVDVVLENLEHGAGLWQQGWVSSGAPQNAVTGKPYKGRNNMILHVASMKYGYNDNRWIHTSEKRSGKVINSFLKAFQKLVSENSQHARDRLREIEDEIRRERAENDGKNSNREEAYRN